MLFRGVEPSGGAAAPELTATAPPSVRPMPVTAVRRGPAPLWLRCYHRALVALEFLAAPVAAVAAVLAGPASTADAGRQRWAGHSLLRLWPAVVPAAGGCGRRLFGTGSEQVGRVVRAALLLLSVAAIVSYAAPQDLSRTLVVVVVHTRAR